MSSTHQPPSLILASKSPRRKYLLEQAGLKFKVVHSKVNESDVPLTTPELYVRELAEAKASTVAQKFPHHWVIGADTAVVVGARILGKPRSIDEARAMLTKLSGRKHRVVTGVAIQCVRFWRFYSNTVSTDVVFKRLTSAEIEWYIQTKEPFDKAGAYAIQGLGTFLVRRINGSYTNVVGLPVCEVVEFLIKEGILGPGHGNHWNLKSE